MITKNIFKNLLQLHEKFFSKEKGFNKYELAAEYSFFFGDIGKTIAYVFSQLGKENAKKVSTNMLLILRQSAQDTILYDNDILTILKFSLQKKYD